MGSDSSTSTTSTSVAITSGSIASGSSTSGSSYSCQTQQKNPTLLLFYVKSNIPKNQYRLNIYHRSASADENCNIVSRISFGHFFISLEGNGSEAFVGRYSENPTIIGPEILHSQLEARTFTCLQKLEVQDNKKYLDKKTIKINKEEYEKAIRFIQEKEPELYNAFTNNCIDFVQQVYNGTGLPLYFTSVYRKYHFDNLKGIAAWQAHSKYKSIDEFVPLFKKISAQTKRHLADALNVNEGCIIQHHDKEYFFINIEEPLKKILKQQDQPSEIDEKVIEEFRIDNMLNHAEINLQEKRKTTFSRIEDIQLEKIEHFNWDAYGKFNTKKLEQKLLIEKAALALKASVKTKIKKEYKDLLLTGNYRGAKREEIRQRMNQKYKTKKVEINSLCHSSIAIVETELKKEVGKKVNQLLKKEFEGLYELKLQEYKNKVYACIKNQSSDNEMHILLSSNRLELEKAMDELLPTLIAHFERSSLHFYDEAIKSIPITFFYQHSLWCFII